MFVRSKHNPLNKLNTVKIKAKTCSLIKKEMEMIEKLQNEYRSLQKRNRSRKTV